MAGEWAEKLALGWWYVRILTATYQAYLIFQGIAFITVSSNNHASPTGALPFLLPAQSSKNPGEAVFPVPSTRIERWVREKNASKEKAGSPPDEVWGKTNQPAEAYGSLKSNTTSKNSSDIRYEAYMSLLNYRIRNAYVSLTSVPRPIVE